MPRKTQPKNWIQGAIKRPGAFTAKAKRAGKSVHEYAVEKQHVPGLLGKQARLALTLEGMRKNPGNVHPAYEAGFLYWDGTGDKTDLRRAARDYAAAIGNNDSKNFTEFVKGWEQAAVEDAKYKPRKRNNPASDASAMFESFHGYPSTETVTFNEDHHYHGNLSSIGDLIELHVIGIHGHKVNIGFEDTQVENPKRGRRKKGPIAEARKTLGEAGSYLMKPVNKFGKAAGEVGDYLDSLIVANPSGSETIPIDKGQTLLCTNEEGTQMYIKGGDQSVDLSVFNIKGTAAEKDSIVLGELSHVVYYTTKDWKDGKKPETADYIHKLSEEDLRKSRNSPLPILVYDRLNQSLSISGGAYHIKRPLFQTSPGIEN